MYYTHFLVSVPHVTFVRAENGLNISVYLSTTDGPQKYTYAGLTLSGFTSGVMLV